MAARPYRDLLLLLRTLCCYTTLIVEWPDLGSDHSVLDCFPAAQVRTFPRKMRSARETGSALNALISDPRSARQSRYVGDRIWVQNRNGPNEARMPSSSARDSSSAGTGFARAQ